MGLSYQGGSFNVLQNVTDGKVKSTGKMRTSFMDSSVFFLLCRQISKLYIKKIVAIFQTIMTAAGVSSVYAGKQISGSGNKTDILLNPEIQTI